MNLKSYMYYFSKNHYHKITKNNFEIIFLKTLDIT